jgi:hypothetical protein
VVPARDKAYIFIDDSMGQVSDLPHFVTGAQPWRLPVFA